MKQPILWALAAALPFPAMAEVSVSAPWARASILASRPGAAYLTLKSDAPDRLTGVESPVAGQVMIHAGDQAGGVSRMAALDALELPAGEPVILAPGGTHLMLMGLEAKLEEGTTFPLTLRFERGGAVTVEVPVLGIAAMGPEGGTQ